MIPMERLSTTPVPAAFKPPDDIERPSMLFDYEMGGAGLSDASQGLLVQTWNGRADPNTGEVWLGAGTTPEQVIFNAPGITELSFTFDQNMRPFFAFVQAGQAKYRWFNTSTGLNEITDLDVADQSPRCCLDDKRDRQTTVGQNDIILAYLRAGNLYYRQQRDRYEIEYPLGPVPDARLIRVGMNELNRLQFLFEAT